MPNSKMFHKRMEKHLLLFHWSLPILQLLLEGLWGLRSYLFKVLSPTSQFCFISMGGVERTGIRTSIRGHNFKTGAWEEQVYSYAWPKGEWESWGESKWAWFQIYFRKDAVLLQCSRWPGENLQLYAPDSKKSSLPAAQVAPNSQWLASSSAQDGRSRGQHF